MSLSGRSVPRAMEPNVQISGAPMRHAALRTSSRLLRKNLALMVGPVGDCLSLSA